MTDTQRYSFVPTQMEMPTIVGGAGCWLHTSDGRRILDGAGGAIVSNIGWGRSEVAEAAAAAMAACGYVVPLWPTPARLALRDRLVGDWLPAGFSHVFFTSGGSESTDSAIRLARAYQVAAGRPERFKVIGRHPSYHGMTIATMSVGSHTGRTAGYEPLLMPMPKIPWDDPAAVAEVISREDPDTIAAVLVEPMTGAAGACLTASDEYWTELMAICRAHDILMMCDEVMTGYGRTGLTWGHQHFPIAPDVIVGGKGLGGGYVPIGAVAATDRVAQMLEGSGFMYFTFSGNDGACAGAAKVLEILQTEQLLARAASMGAVFAQMLHSAFDSHRAVREVRGRGLFYGIEIDVSRDEVISAALARDLWVYPAGSGPVANAVMLAPAFVVSEDELERIVGTLLDALNAVARSGAPQPAPRR